MVMTSNQWDDGLAVASVVWRWRRFIGAAALLSVAATFLMVWWQPPVYEATADLLVFPTKGQPAQVPGTLQQVSGSFLLSDLANLQEARSRQTMQALLESDLLRKEIYASLPPAVAKAVSSPAGLPVKVDNLPGTEILRIRAHSTDTAAAVELANAVARKAVGLGATLSVEASTQGGIRLRSELARSRREVDAASQALKRFCEGYRVTDLPAEMTGVTEKLVELQGKLADARVSLAARQAEIASAVQESKKEPTMVAGGSATVTGPVLELVLPKSARSSSEEVASSQPVAPGGKGGAAAGKRPSSLMDTVRQEPNPVLKDLLVRTASLRTGEASLTARLHALEAETDRLERRYGELRRLEPEWKRLSSAYTVLQQSYEAVLSNQKALEVSRTARLPEAQIVAEAQVSPYPVSPRRVFDLAVALALGLLVGLVGALLLERRTRVRLPATSDAAGVEVSGGDLSRV